MKKSHVDVKLLEVLMKHSYVNGEFKTSQYKNLKLLPARQIDRNPILVDYLKTYFVEQKSWTDNPPSVINWWCIPFKDTSLFMNAVKIPLIMLPTAMWRNINHCYSVEYCL